MTSRLGLTFPIWPTDVRRSCELARRAEALGYTDAWSAETAGPDGLAVATALGVVTETMRIGCAVVPAYTRPPALIAMGALAAQQASAGRFSLGIGASSPTIVERWMGIAFDRPLKQVSETLTAVKAALAGEKVDVAGEKVSIKGFRLETPPEKPVPLFLAALGPQMMQLAAREADGIALFLAAEEGVRMALAAAPGKDVVARLLCCPDEPVEDIRPIARWQLTPYIAVPAYNRFIAAQGFEREAAAVARLWGEGDRQAALDAVSDELVDALVLMGPAAACKERLESFRAAGLGTPILMLFSPRGADGTGAALEAMSPAA
jgi:probable F420-dependent oxidoreductase